MGIRSRLSLLVGIVVFAMGAALAAYFALSADSRAIERDYASLVSLRYAVYSLDNRMNALAANQMAAAFKKFQNAREGYETAYDRVASLKSLPRANASMKQAVERILDLRVISEGNLKALTDIYTQLLDDAKSCFGQADSVILGGFYTDPSLRSRTDLAAIHGRIDAFYTLNHGLNDTLDSTTSSIGNQDQVVKDQIAEIQNRIALLSAVVGLVLVAAALAFSLRFANGIVRPLKDARKLAGAISGGDLTVELDRREYGRGDELGALSSVLERMRSGLASMVGEIRDSLASLRAFGVELSSSMEETAASANGIAATIESVKGQVDAEGGSVRDASSTVELMLASIRDLNGQIADQAASVTQSSASIEEMVANISSVTRNVDLLGDSFGKLLVASDEGKNRLNAVNDIVKGIQNQSDKLTEANTVIETIAEQTNLLAMNAAIEAAHAGESGRGFAVVAEEVRKLSEMAADQSKEISGDIRSITGAIDEMAASADDAETAFGTILSLVGELNSLEKEIRHAMMEQNEGSKQILEALQRINEITANVRGRSQEMNGGSESMGRGMRNLQDMGVKLREGMDEIALGARSIARAVGSISDMGANNSALVDAVAAQVEHFKLGA